MYGGNSVSRIDNSIMSMDFYKISSFPGLPATTSNVVRGALPLKRGWSLIAGPMDYSSIAPGLDFNKIDSFPS